MPQPRRKLRKLDVSAMVASPPLPIEWVVDRIVAPGALTLLSGIAGQGKSLMSMAFALAAAQGGSEVAGIAVEGGTVLYVDAENGEAELHRRIHALGIDQSTIAGLTMVEADGFNLRVDLPDLEQLLVDERPNLMILDSFRSIWDGKEKDDDAIAGVLDPLRNLVRRLGIGTLLIHHAKKDGTTYRGSGAIAASCELAFLLDRQTDDPDRQRRRLRCEKSRPAAEPPPSWLRFASEVELSTGVPLVSEAAPGADVQGRRPATTERREAIMALLADAGGTLSAAAINEALGKSKTDGTTRRALDDLADEGAIARRGIGWVASVDSVAGNPATGVSSHATALSGGYVATSSPIGSFEQANDDDDDAIGGQL
jgi:KaiC/GvpD/RAD55 family RecA-like ATPase